jgi:hypothetical protein
MLKKAWKTIANYFKEHNGKRALFGILLLLVGMWGYMEDKDSSLTMAIIVMGAGLLGLTSLPGASISTTQTTTTATSVGPNPTQGQVG